MKADKSQERRRAERASVCTEMDLSLDVDTIKALSVNVSESGVQLDIEEPLKFWLRLEVDGKSVVREAQIVWAKKKQSGGMSYGFEYTPDTE